MASKLKDRQAMKAIALRLTRAVNGNLGDIKSVGGNVSEMRIFVAKRVSALFYHSKRQGHCIALWWRQIYSKQRPSIGKTNV